MWIHTLPIRRVRCFAPATVNNDASSLIFAVTSKEGASVQLKMQVLCSNLTSQHIRMTRDFKPLRGTPCVPANDDHHSWTEAIYFQFVGCSGGSANQVEISVQIRLVNLHSEKRCIPVSGTLWQRTQARLCVQPLACSLSAVQILSSQPKNLHFGGVQADQMILLRFVPITRMNCACKLTLSRNRTR
jgi:hypothetical protein